MTYAVKELFYTLQGEGAQAGRASVFCRFSGCNLWSGREADRAEAACRFCDTDFVGTDGNGGGRFATAAALAAAIAATWRGRDWGCRDGGGQEDGGNEGRRYVVFTGGEPLLQLDDQLIEAVHALGFTCAIETNGTRPVPRGVDWICVSPKAGVPLHVGSGDELKLVFPQPGLDPGSLAGLAFRHFWLQPMDGPAKTENTRAAVAYCLANPRWRFSLQTHKAIGIA